MTANKSTRSIKVGPGVAMHLIHSQAGTLGKAILEFIMNSVDAQASRVDISIDTNNVIIDDDGIGFDGLKAIKELFEVLCFDHGPEENDHRKFGRFGLGRAQAWAFAATIWRTQTMRMTVDVKKLGLDYELEDGLSNHPGCNVHFQLYEPLTGGDVQRTIREVTDLALYCPVPVYINGEQVSKEVSEQKWDHETDEAYIRLQRHGDLAIYNQGVLVCRYPGYRYGQGGEVVTRKGLAVNVARNDILVSQCKVWKKIEPLLKTEIAKSTKKRKTLTDDERQRLVSDWASGDLEWSDVADKGIIKLITGRSVKPENLFRFRDTPIALGDPDNRFTGDIVHRSKMANVLDPQMYSWFGLFDHGADHADREAQLFEKIRSLLPGALGERLKTSPMHVLAEMANDWHETIPDKDLNKRDKAIVAALRTISNRLSLYANRAFGDELKTQNREIFLGESEASYGWTDGRRYIVIERSHARKVQQGLRGIGEVVHTLMHEQCHDAPTTGDHDHDQSFYERYHDLSRQQGELTRLLLKGLMWRFRHAGISLNKELMAAADLHQQAVGMADPEDVSPVDLDDVPCAAQTSAPTKTPKTRRKPNRRGKSTKNAGNDKQMTLAV